MTKKEEEKEIEQQFNKMLKALAKYNEDSAESIFDIAKKFPKLFTKDGYLIKPKNYNVFHFQDLKKYIS